MIKQTISLELYNKLFPIGGYDTQSSCAEYVNNLIDRRSITDKQLEELERIQGIRK